VNSHFGSFVEVLRFRAETQANAVAFTFLDFSTDPEREVTISYAELDARARSVAANLQCANLAGKRVLLLYPHGIDFIVAFFGCLYSGAIAIPVCPPNLSKHIKYLELIAQNCNPDALLTCKLLSDTTVHSLQQSLILGCVPWIYTDADYSQNAHLWHEFSPQEDQQAYIQYTSGNSGTTGLAKGVILTHQNLISNSEFIRQGFGNNSSSIGVSWLPFYHNMGLVGNVLQPVYVGCKVIFISPQHFIQKPLRWLETISKYQGTTSGGPNFAYELCLRKIKPEDRQRLSLQSWDVAYSGAEIVRPETIEQFQEFFQPCGFRSDAFFPCYGMAEATLMVTGGTRQIAARIRKIDSEALAQGYIDPCRFQKAYRTYVSCGWSFPGQKILIVDPASRRRCAPNRVGEIWISSPSTGQGYWNRTELTAQNFLAYLSDSGEGPFLRTGDLGFLYEGELCVIGRLKDFMIPSEQNSYLQNFAWTRQNSSSNLQGNLKAAFRVEVEEENLFILHDLEQNQTSSTRWVA
jgi:acyl-CoA synthetase (AMP-forming)/AMP-acid ligase II